MSILQFTLIICSIAGCWQPFSWTSLFKHIIYNIHRIFLISVLFTFNITQFIHIIWNVDNSNEFTATIYMMLTVFVAFCKLISMWKNRGNIRAIVNNLKETPFAPLDPFEIMIRQRYEKIAQNTALSYLLLVMSSITSITLTSIFTDFMNGNLTYKAWLPFNYTVPTVFSVVYIHQLTGMALCGIVNVAGDSLVCGFLLHICCQFDILEYRLTKISHDRSVLCDCVRHHDRIYKYAERVNGLFAEVIALQFATSLLVLCSNLNQFATTQLNASLLPLILYTACILAQIFIYCWFGNEVKLKSFHLADNIYNMEWVALNNSNKKDLLIIMKRTRRPIEFTSTFLITMNVDSFVALLKLSYSVYNVLRQTQ